MIDEVVADNTLVDYLDVLNKLYLIEDLTAWNPNLRSKTVIRSSSARFFVDTSIGASALKMTSQKLLKDFETFGLFFESLTIRDLKVYAESMDGEVFRYKDSSGLEIDAIISATEFAYQREDGVMVVPIGMLNN